MSIPFYMPARGERSAPSFDRDKPRELVRFFEELEYLFIRADLQNEADKKRHVLRYVEFELEQLWKPLPEYADTTKSYKAFKEAILFHYPDASGDYFYSLRDMDQLIEERRCLGISSTTDLSDFHLQFLSITNWLIEKQQLGPLEQRRGYLSAFQPQLLESVSNRLQMKFPDHHPNIPHSIQDLYEAAHFILQSAAATPPNYFVPIPTNVHLPFVPNSIVSIAKREPSVAMEDLNSIFSEFAKSIIVALGQSNQGKSSSIKPLNKPGQLATVSLLNTIDKKSPIPSSNSSQLSNLDRIATIETELHILRARNQKHDSMIRTRLQKAFALERAAFKDEDEAPVRTAQQTCIINVSDREEVPSTENRDVHPVTKPIEISQPPVTSEIANSIEHPFRDEDTTYAPLSIPNIDAPVNAPALSQKNDPAYKSLPPALDQSISAEVYKHSMQTPITITELPRLSPEDRSQVRNVKAMRHIPNASPPDSRHVLQLNNNKDKENLFTEHEAYQLESPYFTSQGFSPPKGSTIIDNPIDHYYRSLPPRQAPDSDRLVIPNHSSATRSIFAIVDNTEHIVRIFDPG